MKLVLFDLMDTVLVNPYYDTVGDLTPEGVDVEKFQSVRNMKSFILFERGEISESGFFADYYKKNFNYRESGFPDPRKIKKYLFRQIRYLDGMKNILSDLSRMENVKTGIASNYSVWYLEIFNKRRELEEFFDYIFFSCEMGVRKPDPAYYQMIEESFRNRNSGEKIDEIIFIDDIQENVEAASDCGWTVHCFTDAENLKEFLASSLPLRNQ